MTRGKTTTESAARIARSSRDVSSRDLVNEQADADIVKEGHIRRSRDAANRNGGGTSRSSGTATTSSSSSGGSWRCLNTNAEGTWCSPQNQCSACSNGA